jgi:hypothetical protein
MRISLLMAMAMSLTVLSYPVTAAELSSGRYQIVAYQSSMLSIQSLVLLDTATGDTWLLDAAPAPLPDGSAGTKPTWFVLEKSTTPLVVAKPGRRASCVAAGPRLSE